MGLFEEGANRSEVLAGVVGMDKICDGDARASPACNRRDLLDFDTVAGGPKNLRKVGLDSTSKDAVDLTARREILTVIRPGLSA